MQIRSKVHAALFVGLGILVGQLVASGRLSPSRLIGASQPVNTVAPECPACEKAACCEGVNKGELVALVRHNERVTAQADASGKKPNILCIWGDDIGQSNISAYTFGLMGYRTPNIDRVAREGALFT
ncbi:MAG: arylsulfatase, partial [Gemmataceae bacterium]